ncbi:MAG TPA: HPr-rel-A system PqqD family peptide chaperone [Allosphingosinicella sp.]|nr:HPr-rel-A system PqqD family peptide chaperone [Allosphingosinicella sp.]
MGDPIYIADSRDVRSVPLDGLTLIYHAPSGMTHIVAPPAPEILEALDAGPADPAELLRRLRARFEFEGEDAIHARLEELEASGLVRRG